MGDQLFQAGTTHIEVTCWSCAHIVTLKPEDVPAGITDYDFEKRAICQCGTGWPYVVKFPKKKPMVALEMAGVFRIG